MRPTQTYTSGNAARSLPLGDLRANVRFVVYYADEEERVMSDYSVNMSLGGIFIESEEILPADTKLYVEFTLPVYEKPIRCTSRVAWTNEPANPKASAMPAGMGLQFLDLPLQDVHVIRNFIDEIGLKPMW